MHNIFSAANTPSCRRLAGSQLLSMADDAERIIDLCDRHARSWDGERGRSLLERPTWLRIRVAADAAAAPSGWHA